MSKKMYDLDKDPIMLEDDVISAAPMSIQKDRLEELVRYFGGDRVKASKEFKRAYGYKYGAK